MATSPTVPRATSRIRFAAPHGVWRQVVGLIAWAAFVPFFAVGPVALVAVVIALLALSEAWASRRRGRHRASVSPGSSSLAWGLAMAVLVVVAYPAYLMNRGKLRSIEGTPGFHWAIAVLGGLAVLSCGLVIAGAVLIGGN